VIDRRSLLLALAAAPFAGAAAAMQGDSRAALGALRDRLGPGGRLGVAAARGRQPLLAFEAGERFAMCSTFKLPLAAAMLEGEQEEKWALSDEIAFGGADLLDHAPVVRRNLAAGRMTIEALCRAAVVVSDNAAANLLLARLGGPEALNAALRRWDDRTTRLDRIEPALNQNAPGDSRDTTTPSAMLGLLRTLLFGEPIWHASRVRLANWMAAATTGRDRLRAGFPEGWIAGDKTGSGMNGAHNDVAFALPPDGAEPILVASFISGGDADAAARAAVHAEVARIVVAQAG